MMFTFAEQKSLLKPFSLHNKKLVLALASVCARGGNTFLSFAYSKCGEMLYKVGVSIHSVCSALIVPFLFCIILCRNWGGGLGSFELSSMLHEVPLWSLIWSVWVIPVGESYKNAQYLAVAT